MAAEWTPVRLGNVCSKIGSGATPRGGGGVYLEEGPYTLIRSQNIYNDGFHHNGLAFIGEQHAKELKNVEVREGDVLLNITGDSVARVCQVDSRVLPARVNQHVAIIRPDPTSLHPRFLRYVLISPDMQSRLLSWAGSGGTRNALTKAMIERLEVLAPTDVACQRAIADVLGVLDDKIELNRRMNETLEAMARALFESWFVDFEPVRAKSRGRSTGLPVHLDKLFPTSFANIESGEIPRGWSTATLGSITNKIGSGATPRGGSSVYVDDGIALIRSQNVYDSLFQWDGLARITDQAACSLQGVAVEPEDILLNITGASILRTCIVEKDVLPARVNQHVCIIRPKPGIPAHYVHNHLLRQSTKSYLMGMDAGASRQAVTKGHIESVPLVLPPPPILEQYDRLVGPIFGAIGNHKSESRSLALIRDALLPKLISGDLRLTRAERLVEQVA